MISKKMMQGQRFHGREMTQGWGLVALLSVLVLGLRAAYVQWLHPYGLAPDEAQYWSWLMHNDWSFLTKPPLTTWLIGLGTAVLGTTMLGVKIFALLGQVVSAALGYGLARDVAGNRAGWWTWVLLTTVPLLAAGGLIMSPDAVLVPIWLGVMWLVVKELKAGRDEPRWGMWLGIGVLVGLGGLAKYSAAFLYPLLGAYLLIWRREWLLKPQIWVSGVVALAFQLPVLIWNMQHDWVGIAHVLWQADGGGDDRHGGLSSLLDYVGGQALVLGPVVFGLIGFAGYRVVRRIIGLSAYRVTGLSETWLVWVAGLILLAFGGLALTAKVQANWPVLGAVVGLVVLGIWLGRMDRRWVVYVAVVGVVVNSVLSLMLMDTYKARDLGLLPLKAKLDPTKDLRGWEEMGNLFGLMLYKLDRPIVLASRYQTLSPLMFHTVGQPEFAYINADGKRLNQYDLWPLPDLNGRLVVYVNENGALPEKVKGMFGACEPWHTLAVEEYGIQVRKLSMWLCWNASRVVALGG